MNLVLFDADELARPLPRADRRAVHVRTVLRREVGDTFDAGIVNGPRGRATLTAIGEDGALTLAFTATTPPGKPAPITLLIGLPRPQTARDILRDATTAGVAALHFVRTAKAEASYATSSLWNGGEWRRHALAGAEQAFDTRVPEITHGRTLAAGLAAVDAAALRLALDNYEAPQRLGSCELAAAAGIALAIGAERGWSEAERTALRTAGFRFVHLGSRVLRTEAAVLAALAIVRAQLGLM
jgi:RsmE family RNA methyltransferase